jgi:hypothetical protein
MNILILSDSVGSKVVWKLRDEFGLLGIKCRLWIIPVSIPIRNHPIDRYKTICLLFENEAQYDQCMTDDSEYRKHIEYWTEIHPELFPPDVGEGFLFYGSYHSRQQQIDLRRIEMKKSEEVYQIRPSFLMPYMMARTDDVEKALFLRMWNVSFDGLAYVFGRDAMYWYRMTLQLGRPSLVRTTVKDPAMFPRHLVADEKQRGRGEKISTRRQQLPTDVFSESVRPPAPTNTGMLRPLT